MPIPTWGANFPMPGDLPGVVAWLTSNLQRLRNVLVGPSEFAQGNSGATVTVQLAAVDLTTLTLNANTTITLDLTSGAANLPGVLVALELLQDATGSRTVAWVNAIWTGGTPPTITATAGKRTLFHFLRNDSGWVGWIVAQNY